MEKANNEISQLQKRRRMRNCRKKRRRQERALANRMVNEEVLAQKISGALKEQKASLRNIIPNGKTFLKKQTNFDVKYRYKVTRERYDFTSTIVGVHVIYFGNSNLL